MEGDPPPERKGSGICADAHPESFQAVHPHTRCAYAFGIGTAWETFTIVIGICSAR